MFRLMKVVAVALSGSVFAAESTDAAAQIRLRTEREIEAEESRRIQ